MTTLECFKGMFNSEPVKEGKKDLQLVFVQCTLSARKILCWITYLRLTHFILPVTSIPILTFFLSNGTPDF